MLNIILRKLSSYHGEISVMGFTFGRVQYYTINMYYMEWSSGVGSDL